MYKSDLIFNFKTLSFRQKEEAMPQHIFSFTRFLIHPAENQIWLEAAADNDIS